MLPFKAIVESSSYLNERHKLVICGFSSIVFNLFTDCSWSEIHIFDDVSAVWFFFKFLSSDDSGIVMHNSTGSVVHQSLLYTFETNLNFQLTT